MLLPPDFSFVSRSSQGALYRVKKEPYRSLVTGMSEFLIYSGTLTGFRPGVLLVRDGAVNFYADALSSLGGALSPRKGFG